MCSSQRPLNGADSAQEYVVSLRSQYDDDERDVVKVSAHDEREAKRLARGMRPGFYATTARAA